MKTIVAGSRGWDNSSYIFDILDLHNEITEIVCGESQGPDSYGRIWGENRSIPISSFPAKWDKYGKSAGILRNIDMGDHADQLIAFWNGKSRGTKHMIDYMNKLNKKVTIYE